MRRACVVLLVTAFTVVPTFAAHGGVKVIKRIDLSRYEQPHAKMIPADLDGDGEIDFLFTSGTRVARAIRSDGTLLWEIVHPKGIPNREPYHPWTSAVWDIDNDGDNEAIIFRKRGDEPRPYLAVVNGRKGSIEVERKLWFEPTTDSHSIRGLMAIAYLRDRENAGIVVGSNDTLNDVAAYDGKLQRLWYRSFEREGRPDYAGHYIWPYDIDGDGLHELFVGKRLLRGDGTELWWMEDFGRDHVDSLACGDIDPGIAGKEVVVCGASGARMYDRHGKLLWKIPLKTIRDPQRLVLGEFRKGVPGLEVAITERYSVPDGRTLLFDCRGKLLPTSRPFVRSGKMQIDWDGDRSEDELLGHEGHMGGVENGQGERIVDPSWYVRGGGRPSSQEWWAYPLAIDVTGDSREEIIQWGRTELVIGTNDAPNPAPAPSFRADRDYRLRYANMYMNRSPIHFDYRRRQ